jgi:hypothetical protein
VPTPEIISLSRLQSSSVESLQRLLSWLGAKVPRRRRDEYVEFYRLRLALAASFALAGTKD